MKIFNRSLNRHRYIIKNIIIRYASSPLQKIILNNIRFTKTCLKHTYQNLYFLCIFHFDHLSIIRLTCFHKPFKHCIYILHKLVRYIATSLALCWWQKRYYINDNGHKGNDRIIYGKDTIRSRNLHSSKNKMNG